MTTETSVCIIDAPNSEHIFFCGICAFCGYSNMCKKNNLQRHIAKFTNNGEDIARFLAETVRGETPGVKACHRMEAMKYILRLNSTDQPDSEYREDDKFWGLIPTPEELATKKNTPSPSTGEGRDGGDTTVHTQPAKEPADAQDRPTENSELTTQDSQPTYLDILNFNLAQLVRSETAEGHTIAEFLYQVMTGRDKAFTPNKLKIKPSDRMAASREILRRGYGHFGRRRKLIDDAEETNDYDTLHSDLAKRLRQYGEQGSHAILFLHDVMRNAYPEEEYTMRHRVSAAQELLRRGWDTNYDRIKQEHLLAYWRDQQDARLSVGQKKQLAGLHAYADEYQTYDTTDYNSIAQELRQAEDNEDSAATKSLPPRRGKVRMGVNTPAQSESNEDEATSTRHSREEPAPSAGKNSTTPNRHSREACPRPRSGSGNPVGKGGDGINTPSPSTGEGRDGGENPTNPVIPTKNSQPTTQYSQLNTDDSPDCYYEPLSPEDQAIFDYQTLIETGEYKKGELEIQPPTEAAHQEYAATLKWMRQAATAEGIPLLPNPLSGALKRPTARSP